MMTDERIWPDVAIPPGELLAETLFEMDMTQAELARRAGRPVQVFNEIIQGKKEITAETALQLERVLGTPAHVWIGLEADFRFTKARLQDRVRLKQEVPLAAAYPYGEMAKRGWVPRVQDGVDRVCALLAYFRVGSLNQAPEVLARFRKSESHAKSQEALSAWVWQGHRQAEMVETETFDSEGIADLLPTLRASILTKPRDFQSRVARPLADKGVAVVLVPELPRAGVNGATYWIGDKAVIQLCIRYKWADIFWFTVFHELCHILKHGRKGILETGQDDEREREANGFAADLLIPPRELRSFLKRESRFSGQAIKDFARSVGTHPGVVVGRLQHDRLLPYSHLNDLRQLLRWSDTD